MRNYSPARVIVVAVFFTVAAVGLLAVENDVFKYPVDAIRSSGLQSVLEDIAEANVIKGRFLQVKTIRKIGRSFESKGFFLFSGESGIVWDVVTPFPSTLVLRKDSMIQRNPDGGSTVIEASDNPIFINFASAILAVFSGDYQELQIHYNVFFVETASLKTIGLKPRDSGVSAIIDSLVLIANDSLQSLLMEETTGDTVEYRFMIDKVSTGLTDEEHDLFSR